MKLKLFEEFVSESGHYAKTDCGKDTDKIVKESEFQSKSTRGEILKAEEGHNEEIKMGIVLIGSKKKSGKIYISDNQYKQIKQILMR